MHSYFRDHQSRYDHPVVDPAAFRGWIEARMVAKPDLTLDDLVLELADRHSIMIHRVSVWRVLRSLGLTHKKRHPSRRTEAA